MNRTKQVKRIGTLPPPAPTPLQKIIPLALNLVFQDGTKEIGRLTMNGTFPLPVAGQQVNLDIPIDARQLFAALESQLGPTKPKLWTPRG